MTRPADDQPMTRPYRVCLVCLGNICRSPIAEVVLEDRITSAGLADRVEVVSAGTGGWHVGDPIDRRAAAVLSRHGYDPTRHRAQRFERSWSEDCDLVLAMDAQNRRDIEALGNQVEVGMFRDYDPEGPGDVPDPYYGGADGFEDVLAMVERTADALVSGLALRTTGT